MLAYPIASTPLSDDVALTLVRHLGPSANPAQMVTIECEDVASLIETVQHTDAIFLGIVKAAERGLRDGSLVEMKFVPEFSDKARFALTTLAGRTAPPALAIFRRLIRERMGEDHPRQAAS